jgi:hypothetical protein
MFPEFLALSHATYNRFATTITRHKAPEFMLHRKELGLRHVCGGVNLHQD